ncbi:MAG: hypothetical protein EHM80_12435 [Nitrospiraceae bacterium]|nr:MAG: hypothetical protein EHM80_12435 [Nitrospiraceae bacterium]
MYTLMMKHLPAGTKGMAIVALMTVSALSLVIAPTPARSAEPEKGPSSTHETLMKAHEQLEIAIHYAELAVAPHQPGVGWHKAHTQRAINVVVGAGNPDFNKDVENPGDGHGVMKYLQDAHDAMKGCTPINTCDAIESSLEYLRAAVEHGKQSIEMSRMSGMERRQARMFGALLRAAHGTRDTESATMGAMAYAIRVTEHMPEHK